MSPLRPAAAAAALALFTRTGDADVTNLHLCVQAAEFALLVAFVAVSAEPSQVRLRRGFLTASPLVLLAGAAVPGAAAWAMPVLLAAALACVAVVVAYVLGRG